MSVLTNPASGAREDAARYIAAVLGLLGDGDPLDVLFTTAAWCDARTADLTLEQLRRPESPGKWSIGEVLAHLADAELVWGWRLRRVLAEDRPELTGFDQDLWARRLGYAAASRERSLETFRVLRAGHLEMLAGLDDADLDRVGVHTERGEESVRHLMRLYAGHDLAHRNQIERIRTAIGA